MPLSKMGTITLKYRVLDECAQRHHSHTHSPTNKINIHSFVFINLKTNLNRSVSTLLDVPFLLLSLVPFPSYPSKIIHVTSIRINRANASFPFSKALKILLWLLRLHFFLSSLSIPLTLSISVALSLFVSSGLSFFLWQIFINENGMQFYVLPLVNWSIQMSLLFCMICMVKNTTDFRMIF